MTITRNAEAGRDTLVERLFGSALGALDLFCIYLGDQLGMYRALVDEGPSTSTDYGADLHEGQARFTQPMFDNLLATDWFPSAPASTIASIAIAQPAHASRHLETTGGQIDARDRERRGHTLRGQRRR